MAVAAAAVAPFALADAGPDLLGPSVLAAGAVGAVLSSLLPDALEAVTLRRQPSNTFTVLMSLAPALAAITGATLRYTAAEERRRRSRGGAHNRIRPRSC